MNVASVVVTCEVVGTLSHYKMVKKIELCALRSDGDVKTIISSSLALALSLVVVLVLAVALSLALALVLFLALEIPATWQNFRYLIFTSFDDVPIMVVCY